MSVNFNKFLKINTILEFFECDFSEVLEKYWSKNITKLPSDKHICAQLDSGYGLNFSLSIRSIHFPIICLNPIAVKNCTKYLRLISKSLAQVTIELKSNVCRQTFGDIVYQVNTVLALRQNCFGHQLNSWFIPYFSSIASLFLNVDLICH